MFKRPFGGAALALLLSLTGSASAQPNAHSELRALLAACIETQRATGIVVGIVRPTGREIVSLGTRGGATAGPVDGDTLFEIGSITKIFTALALAELVERGVVGLDDPVSRHLSRALTASERAGGQITLHDLATHRSGLPRIPPGIGEEHPDNPYLGYGSDELFRFLAGYQLPRQPGAEFEYSNLGFGLLGLALVAATRAPDYEQMLSDLVLAPAGLTDTVVTVDAARLARMAQGHDYALRPVPNWDFGALAGAGALRSSANDLLSLLEIGLGLTDSPLEPAFARTTIERAELGEPGLEIGLGWIIVPDRDSEVIWLNGGTGGFRSFIGFNKAEGTGVVVLVNSATSINVDGIGLHLLAPGTYPLPKAPEPRRR